MKKLVREVFAVGVGVVFNGKNKGFLTFYFNKIDNLILKKLDEKIMRKHLVLHVDFSNEEEASYLLYVVNIILNLKFLSKELKESKINDDDGIFVQVEIEIDHVNKSISTALQADIVHLGIIKQFDNMVNHKIFNLV